MVVLMYYLPFCTPACYFIHNSFFCDVHSAQLMVCKENIFERENVGFQLLCAQYVIRYLWITSIFKLFNINIMATRNKFYGLSHKLTNVILFVVTHNNDNFLDYYFVVF